VQHRHFESFPLLLGTLCFDEKTSMQMFQNKEVANLKQRRLAECGNNRKFERMAFPSIFQ